MIRYSQTLFRLGLVSVAVLGVSLAAPAHAGFKWVSPVASTGGSAPSAQMQAPQPMPQITDDPVLVIEGAPYQSNNAQSYNVAPQPLMAQQQITPTTAPAPSYVAPMASASTGQVEGFADNIPLSVALRQVVPQTHGFSVDQGIDMNTLVSWRGG